MFLRNNSKILTDLLLDKTPDLEAYSFLKCFNFLWFKVVWREFDISFVPISAESKFKRFSYDELALKPDVVFKLFLLTPNRSSCYWLSISSFTKRPELSSLPVSPNYLFCLLVLPPRFYLLS